MATLPKLVTALQEVDGRERKTIEQMGRTLRESGFLPKGKSGAGAPRMDFDEAANLLLGVYGSNSPKDTPITCARLGSLTPDDGGSINESELDGDITGLLSEVSNSPNLKSALSTLLTGYPDLLRLFDRLIEINFPNPNQQEYFLKEPISSSTYPISLSVRLRPSHFCEIAINTNFGPPRKLWAQSFTVDLQLFEDGFYGRERHDRTVEISFGMKTFQKLYLTLVEGVKGLDPLLQ